MIYGGGKAHVHGFVRYIWHAGAGLLLIPNKGYNHYVNVLMMHCSFVSESLVACGNIQTTCSFPHIRAACPLLVDKQDAYVRTIYFSVTACK